MYGCRGKVSILPETYSVEKYVFKYWSWRYQVPQGNCLTLRSQNASMILTDSSQQRHRVQESSGLTSSIKVSFFILANVHQYLTQITGTILTPAKIPTEKSVYFKHGSTYFTPKYHLIIILSDINFWTLKSQWKI